MAVQRFLLLCIALALAPLVRSQCLSEQLAPPAPAQDWESYIQWLETFRETMLANIDYSGQIYDDLPWVRTLYVQPQAMAHDRYLYDPVANQWTVDRYLDDVEARYGGIDAILLSLDLPYCGFGPTYPNIGVDDRNQFDLIRGMGGGNSLSQMVADFHARGVKVLFPYNPWDVGTRRESTGDAQTLAELIVSCNANGFNGDTMAGIPAAFQEEAQKAGYAFMLQPEVGMPDTDVSFLDIDAATWGYWAYGQMPTLSKYKWLEPRHMINICDRWAFNHTQDLQNAFFNGVGFESWENVWSFWNGMTDYDAEALRRVAAILRYFSAPYLASADWLPYFPTAQDGVYCSYFPNNATALFLFIERYGRNVSGVQLVLPGSQFGGFQFYDAYHGQIIVPKSKDGEVSISFDIEANGYGAVFATTHLTPSLKSFLTNMSDMTQRPLESYSTAWAPLPQTFTARPATPLASSTPEGMVRIQGGDYRFINEGVMIEGSDLPGIDVQYPGEPYPSRYHNLTLPILTFYMDIVPVSNAQFAAFLNTTNYTPSDAYNFLRDWSNGTYPSGWDKKPVTWVSMQDSEAYCEWAGKRLPHDWEWQYAAQGGNDSLMYPWGNEWNPNCVPMPDFGPVMYGPDASDAHPCGAQISNVGNVWQWTDEVTDEHTQSAIVRGGSYYQPQVAWSQNWYFPQAYALNQHGKYLRMSPSLDRSGAIGFRCVKDATQ